MSVKEIHILSLLYFTSMAYNNIFQLCVAEAYSLGYY